MLSPLTPPQKSFDLHADASPSILMAEGIGITAIKPIAETLKLRGRRFQLHYTGRNLDEMAFSHELTEALDKSVFIYTKDGDERLDVLHILADAPHNAYIYACGFHKLIDDVYSFANALGIHKDRIQCENLTPENQDKDVVIELVRSNKLIRALAGQSLLTAIRDANIPINFDCCVGDCGTCATKVLEGDIEHRDHTLSDQDKANGFMCLCVSRAKSEKIKLDL